MQTPHVKSGTINQMYLQKLDWSQHLIALVINLKRVCVLKWLQCRCIEQAPHFSRTSFYREWLCFSQRNPIKITAHTPRQVSNARNLSFHAFFIHRRPFFHPSLTCIPHCRTVSSQRLPTICISHYSCQDWGGYKFLQSIHPSWQVWKRSNGLSISVTNADGGNIYCWDLISATLDERGGF